MPRRKAWTVRDGDVLLFVCSSVLICLFVCHLKRTLMTAEAYHVGHTDL